MKEFLNKIENSLDLNLIKEAIEKNSLNNFASELLKLDEYLTGNKNRQFSSQEQGEFADFLNNFKLDKNCGGFVKIYLGDGGMSRVIIYSEKGKIFLELSAYNSTEEVKEKWKELFGDNFSVEIS